jgi:hypothetical protein
MGGALRAGIIGRTINKRPAQGRRHSLHRPGRGIAVVADFGTVRVDFYDSLIADDKLRAPVMHHKSSWPTGMIG